MEYVDKGSVMKGKDEEEPLPLHLAREYFRHLIAGLEYRTTQSSQSLFSCTSSCTRIR